MGSDSDSRKGPQLALGMRAPQRAYVQERDLQLVGVSEPQVTPMAERVECLRVRVLPGEPCFESRANAAVLTLLRIGKYLA
jgi:hypothetical protein